MTRYYRYEGLEPENLTAASCFVCGSRESTPIGVDNGFQVVECACGFVFVNPRPNAAQLAAFYERYYEPSARGQQGAGGHETDTVPEKWEREMGGVFDECREWLVAGRARGDVLDVGCSFGHFLGSMEACGWNATGVEPSSSAAAYAGRHLRGTVHHGGFEDVELAPASFDAVVSLYVLEHVSDPRAFMEKVYRVLRSDGQAVIRIPYTRPLFPLNRLLRRPLMYAPMHLNDFPPDAMRRLGASLGFRRVEVHVGRPRKAHDPVEYLGAAVLGNIGRAVEIATRGQRVFPFAGALSYRLFK